MIPGWPIDEGEPTGEWTTLATLAFGYLDVAEEYFANAAKSEPGLDRRAQGAYFLGGLSFYLSSAPGLARPARPAAARVPDEPVRHHAGRCRPPEFWLRARGPSRCQRGHHRPERAWRRSCRASRRRPVRPMPPNGASSPTMSRAASSMSASIWGAGRGVAIGRELVRNPDYRFFNGRPDYYNVDGQCFSAWRLLPLLHGRCRQLLRHLHPAPARGAHPRNPPPLRPRRGELAPAQEKGRGTARPSRLCDWLSRRSGPGPSEQPWPPSFCLPLQRGLPALAPAAGGRLPGFSACTGRSVF